MLLKAKSHRCLQGHIIIAVRYSSKKREGFGSFHSQDIETLIRLPVSEYKPPLQLLEIEDRLNIKSSKISTSLFGSEMKQSLFMLRENDTFINHGAFGGAIKPLHELAAEWRNVLEQNPLEFFDQTLLPVLAHSVRAVAAYIQCPATELIPLPNVTTGLNSIFNSLELHSNDEIICFSLTYGATKTMLRHLAARTGAKLIIIDLPLPILSKDIITSEFQKQLSEKTKLVVLDQITSNTALSMPIHKLGQLGKSVGALVVVDAAHSLGSQEVSIYKNQCKTSTHLSTQTQTQGLSDVCDVWLSNGHKWLCMPRGCAFMWVHPSLHGRLRPAIISHGYVPGTNSDNSNSSSSSNSSGSSGAGRFSNKGDLYAREGRLLSAFVWDGCRDYASVLTTSSALHFWGHTFPKLVKVDKYTASANTASIATTTTATTSNSTMSTDGLMGSGWEMVRQYNRSLLAEAVQLLETDWKVSCEHQVAPAELTYASPMRLVRLISFLISTH